jgi:putative transcriptional regulator
MTDAQRIWEIRRRLRLTQREFAGRFAIPYGVVTDVEQGRFQPVQSLRVLLAAIDMAPDVVARAAAGLK